MCHQAFHLVYAILGVSQVGIMIRFLLLTRGDVNYKMTKWIGHLIVEGQDSNHIGGLACFLDYGTDLTQNCDCLCLRTHINEIYAAIEVDP